MATNFTRSHGANARAQSWEDFDEENRDQRTGSWLPLETLDEEGYVATPQLRAMPAGKRQILAPAQAAGQIRPTTAHPALAPQRQRATHESTQTRPVPGVQARTLAMMAGAVLCALAVYVTVSSALEWAQVKIDDLQYGRPRTAQIDAYVGHNEAEGLPTHFIGMNLNRRVTVLEIPGGDSAKLTTIVGPYLFGEGEDLTPVQVSVQDVNADAKPDLVVTAKNEQLIYLNDGTAFKLITPEERAALEKSQTPAKESATNPSAPQEAGK